MREFVHVRSLAASLRGVSLFMIFNGVCLLLPERWIDSWLVSCGVGPLPDAMLVRYLLHGAGFLFLSLAVLIWVIASDVTRFQPVVVTLIVICLADAPISYFIDTYARLPWWWRLGDFVLFALSGGVPLVFAYGSRRKSSNQPMQRTAGRIAS